MPPSIGESSGIPKGKKYPHHVERRLRPLFTGQVFFQPPGLRSRDSRKPTEGASVGLRAGGSGMSAHPWPESRIRAMVRTDSIAFPFLSLAGLHDRIKTDRAGADRARRAHVPRHHLGGL